MRTGSKERLRKSPPGTATPPSQAEKTTRPGGRIRLLPFRILPSDSEDSFGNGQSGEQSFDSNSTIPPTPEAPKTQKRNLKRPIDDNSDARQEPSTSSGGGKKNKAGTSSKSPEKKSGQTSQNGAKKTGGKQIRHNDNLDTQAEIERLNKIVAELTDENKMLKKTAATNGAVLAKEKAEKENLQNVVDEMRKEASRTNKQLMRMEELKSTTAKVVQEKSDMEKTLTMLQNEVAQVDELRENNTRLERDKNELEQTLAALQVPAGSQLEDAFRQALECPICFDVRDQVVQCVQGHPICTQCQQGLPNQECPVCKAAYSAGLYRNRVAEELARALNNA